jgi:hypothetical protein
LKEVVEDGAGRDDVFEQRTQIGNVPLAVAELVDELVLRLFGRDVEGLVEGAVRRMNAQAAVKNQERLTDGVDDILGIRLDLLEQMLRAPFLRDVFHRQQHELVVQLAGVEQHDPPANMREVVLELVIVEDHAFGNDVFEQRGF